MTLHNQHLQITELIAEFGRRNKNKPVLKNRDENTRPVIHLGVDDIYSRQVQRLKNHHLRPTVARISVLAALEQSAPQCLDAGQLYAILHLQLAQATIYRVLHDIWEAGLVVRSRGEQNRTKFGLRPDGQNRQKIALGCHCGARLVFIEDKTLYEQLHSLAGEAGFDIDNDPVFIISTACTGCRDCRQENR